MDAKIKNIKRDRLRYTKNSFSATLTYLAIVFNVLYFVNIYQTDIGNYFYTITTGVSVVCNLMFLLIAFLSSEGLKNYKISYAFIVITLGAFQLIRVLGIPTAAHKAVITLEGDEMAVMGDKQFYYLIICLVLSAVACIVAGIIGLYKSLSLRKHLKENGLA